MNIKKSLVIGAVALTISPVASTALSSATVYAHEAEQATIHKKDTQDEIIEEQTNKLPDDKKKEFNELVQSGYFSKTEQVKLLQAYTTENGNFSTRSVKTKAIKKLAKWLAAKVGSKTIADITDYLFGWQDDLQTGAENFLVDHGWNRTVAHWSVKSIMFVLF